MNISLAVDKIVQSLSDRYGEREASNIARIVMEDAFGYFFPFKTQDIDEVRLDEILEELTKGVPVQYVLGETNFYGLQIFVNPNVLIPRPETEELVYTIFESYKDKSRPMRILDIGTGSGCIPIALKMRFEKADIVGVDLSEGAIDLARKNAANNNYEIEFKQLDFLEQSNWAQIEGPWDIIVSNPPYIPESEKVDMGESVIAHEPHMALFTKDDFGQEFYAAIAQFAKEHLKEDGCVFCELNEFRTEKTLEIFKEATFEGVSCINDMQGKPRMLKAVLKNI